MAILGTPTWKQAAVVIVALGFAGGLLLYGMTWRTRQAQWHPSRTVEQ